MPSFFSKFKVETVKNVLELIKYFVEILAIIIAGLWAYSKYIEIEKPVLGARSSSASELQWYKTPDKDNCMGRFGMTIKNIGTKPFMVDKVIVQAWLVDEKIMEHPFKFMSPQNEKKTLLDERRYGNNSLTSLIGRYSAGEENQMDFTYLIKHKKSSIALFVVRATGPQTNIEESRWGFVCDM